MIVSNDTIIARWPEHGPERENVPNARLIVRAVNNFQPMLDALRELSEAVKPTREGKRDGGTFGRLSMADDNARAILATVEGEQ